MLEEISFCNATKANVARMSLLKVIDHEIKERKNPTLINSRVSSFEDFKVEFKEVYSSLAGDTDCYKEDRLSSKATLSSTSELIGLSINEKSLTSNIKTSQKPKFASSVFLFSLASSMKIPKKLRKTSTYTQLSQLAKETDKIHKKRRTIS